jgi:peptide deformylase
MRGVETAYINPVILKRRRDQRSEEGCLSIPGIFGRLNRADILDVEYFDAAMNRQRARLRGFESVVFQHEYDHLAGILFIDYFDPVERGRIADVLAEIEDGKVDTRYLMSFKERI